MNELHIALIFAAALIGGALLYRRKKDSEWPEQIYQRRAHWPPHQYGENVGGKAWVDPAYEHPWAAMCQEVFEAVSSERRFLRRNLQGFEVEIQAILRDNPLFDADYQRQRIARWVVNPASPYGGSAEDEAQIVQEMELFSPHARRWLDENADRIKRPA